MRQEGKETSEECIGQPATPGASGAPCCWGQSERMTGLSPCGLRNLGFPLPPVPVPLVGAFSRVINAHALPACPPFPVWATPSTWLDRESLSAGDTPSPATRGVYKHAHQVQKPNRNSPGSDSAFFLRVLHRILNVFKTRNLKGNL